MDGAGLPPGAGTAAPPLQRLVAGPFNRVEGDLEVTLDIAAGRVAAARVTAPMYRGFEQILLGKAPRDALAIVPRICGICSVTQSVAAASALAALAGVAPPPNGRLATRLTLATENVADHLTHFHLFFMADFAHAAYADQPWHAEAVRRFAPGRGTSTRDATVARQRWMTLMGTLAGKWPHTLSLEPGGSARAIDGGERQRLLARLREFRAFVQERWLGDRLEAVAALDSMPALWRWVDAVGPEEGGDLRFFLRRARELGLAQLGRGPTTLLCVGHGGDGDAAVPAGVYDATTGAVQPLDAGAIHEDVSHAWMAAASPAHPSAGRTEPQPGRPGAYTWSKAPRLAGRVAETGALARQLMARQPLLVDAVREAGAGQVLARVLARAVEVATVLPAMERDLHALQLGEPWCVEAPLPADGAAAGFVEAARGALGHWLRVERGRIAGYQIVAPTTWNFSPRDEAGQPGPLEQALEGVAVPDARTVPPAVHHVVRSFDPCMVCTVH